MHKTAMQNGKRFFDCYASLLKSGKIVDIGAQNVNGSLREVAPPALEYVGVDFIKAAGVDIVLDDPYKLPFEDNSVDVLVSSSCLEHSEMFWLSFLEMMRVLKPHGLCYLNVPSNGHFHRYPVDCWRFYPDSGIALVNWAKRNGYNPCLLESYISSQEGDTWNDCVTVFIKNQEHVEQYPNRITDNFKNYYNAIRYPEEYFGNFEDIPEDRFFREFFKMTKNSLRRKFPSFFPKEKIEKLKVKI